MSNTFPRIEAACAASTEAMAQQYAAQTTSDRLRASHASRHAAELARAAYGEELLPRLFGGAWRLSRHNHNYPPAILTPRRCHVHVSSHALFDHPLVYRLDGTRGPDSPKNCVIIGRPYGAVVNGELTTFARQDAAQLAGMGWGIWWRPDLSTWYPGWTQLVVAKHGIQACGTPEVFRPIASPGLGVGAWDEWAMLPAGWR